MLCFETIRVENRQLKNLSYHQARLNKTRRELWGCTNEWDLSALLEIPDLVDHNIHKCRVAYGKDIDNIKWEPYSRRTIGKIRRVYHNEIDYQYKYDNRDTLNTLFAQRGDADEILIIKNGLVTDSNYCNVAFWNGSQWLTPDSPLLPGTQRAFLLDQGVIRTAEICETDINSFSQIRLFNAMVDWANAATLDVSLIA
ncbi:aminotransferase class IV family protein [Dyadobacter sp. CY261]|uniref:aminotransferase class IV family protein n=1 Tax=Dyadobacter sp. CY261 TaxID=2907203 RepID=UPI001F19142F|nr:aminotransferase class IV family protein [Dyadobacter sp. CY261]MCF0071420.1 aminotransferase class IV family protein [Dyadobacter sp. CY261]